MSKMQHPDLEDDQIRFISSSNIDKPEKKIKSNRKIWWITIAALIVVVAGVFSYVYYKVTSTREEIAVKKIEATSTIPVDTVSADTTFKTSAEAYTLVQDTTVGAHRFTILTPVGGKPELVIGNT